MRAAVIAKYKMMEEAGKIKPGFLFEQANLVHILPRLSCHLTEELIVADKYADEIAGLEVFTPPTQEEEENVLSPEERKVPQPAGDDAGADGQRSTGQPKECTDSAPSGSSEEVQDTPVQTQREPVLGPGFRDTRGRY